MHARKLREGRKYGWTAVKRWFWDTRTYGWKRTQYWKLAGGSAGSHLHHWLIPNSASTAPLPNWAQGFRQAGLNHLEVPGALNVWMGGIERREKAFRNIVFGILGASGLTAASIANDLLPDVEGSRAVPFLPSARGLLQFSSVPTGDGTSKNK